MAENPSSSLMKLRVQRGLTQQGLADALGVTVQTVRNWERGRSIPRLTISQVKLLLHILQVDISDLPDDFGPKDETISPLKYLRERAGLTREGLVEGMKKRGSQITVELIQQWENNHLPPELSVFQIADICDEMGITVRQFAACFSEDES